MIPQIAKITNTQFEKYRTEGPTTNILMTELIQDITGEVVGQLFFTDEFSKHTIDGTPFAVLNCRASALKVKCMAGSPLCIIFGPKIVDFGLTKLHRDYLEILAKIKKLTNQIIENKFHQIKKQKAEGTYKPKVLSLMDILYETQEKEDPDQAFSIPEVADEFLTFLGAGTDTTSHLVNMASYMYLNNPQCHENILKEID